MTVEGRPMLARSQPSQGADAAVRASDQDRARTVDELRRHAVDGRLTLDEFADRVGVALAASSRADLQALVSDLPIEPAAEPRRTTNARRWVVALMSGAQVKGRWNLGRSVTAVAVMGACELDPRAASFSSSEVRITAISVMGGVHIVVPEGIAVELKGIPIMGHKHLAVADVPVLAGSPTIYVRAFPLMGGVSVRSKPARRSDATSAPDENAPRSY